MAIGAYGDRGSARGSSKSTNQDDKDLRRQQSSPYNSVFRGSVRNPGFRPVRAIDNSKKIEKQNRDILRDMQEQQKASERNNRLGETYLRGQQTVEKAELRADQIAESASMAGKSKMFEGIAQLSKTALDGLQVYSEYKEEKRLDDEAQDFLFGTGGASIVGDTENQSLDTAVQQSVDDEVGVVSTEVAIGQITDDPNEANTCLLYTSPSPRDPE